MEIFCKFTVIFQNISSENTTITQGANAMTYNLSGTGDFNIQDNGTTHFQVRDDGLTFFGDDTYWRDDVSQLHCQAIYQ